MRALAALFAKVPTPGRSKTRLAPLVGEHHASALARCFLQDTWSRLQTIEDLDLVLSCPDTDIDRFDLRPEPRCWGQGDGDLGARIEHTLRRGLERADVVLAIGADSPDLPATRIREAIEALERTEAVLLPAEDGGFVLLGLRSCPDGLLYGLPWSSPHTCEATAQRLQQRGVEKTGGRAGGARARLRLADLP